MKITLSFWISRVVPKTSSFRVRVNTTSRRGIKQLGIYFGSVSIFPMKVAGGHWFIVAGDIPTLGSLTALDQGQFFPTIPNYSWWSLGANPNSLFLSLFFLLITRNRPQEQDSYFYNYYDCQEQGCKFSTLQIKFKKAPSEGMEVLNTLIATSFYNIIIGKVCAEKYSSKPVNIRGGSPLKIRFHCRKFYFWLRSLKP